MLNGVKHLVSYAEATRLFAALRVIRRWRRLTTEATRLFAALRVTRR
jgi:hypothetical protein